MCSKEDHGSSGRTLCRYSSFIRRRGSNRRKGRSGTEGMLDVTEVTGDDGSWVGCLPTRVWRCQTGHSVSAETDVSR